MTEGQRSREQVWQDEAGSNALMLTVDLPDSFEQRTAPSIAADLSPISDETALRAKLSELADRLFDRQSYLTLYPDIAAGSVDNPDYAENHFRNHGLYEGRSPSVLFDTPYVLQRLMKFDGVQVAHEDAFVRFAAVPPERRFVPNRWFSPWAFRRLYAADHPELAGMSDYQLFDAYATRCCYAAMSPNGAFNEERYRALYPNVAAAVGNREIGSGFLHFVTFGCHESYVNLPAAQLAQNAGNDPRRQAHWLLSGQVGLEKLFWWFDEAFYLSVYPDVHDLVRRSIVKSGFEHFMIAGFHDGRVPSPVSYAQLPADRSIDPWDWCASLPDEPAQGLRLTTLSKACAMLREIDRPGWSGARQTASEAIWPFVSKPMMGGSNALDQYFAVNSDLEPLGRESETGKRHWFEYGMREDRMAPGSNLFSDRSITLADALAWRNGVNFFGPVSASKGLGSAARGYVAALRTAGVEVDVYDTDWLNDRKLPPELFCSDDLRFSINFMCFNADQITSFVKLYGTGLFNHRANVGVWVWELAAPRPEWRMTLSAFDLIITPSRFCTDSFALSTDIPVRTVPYVVDADDLIRLSREPTSNPAIAHIAERRAAGKKIVLFVMDASSMIERKGIDLFCELAERIDRQRPGEYLFIVKSHSRDISLTALPRFRKPIYELQGVFSFADLCRLKSMADLYVSPHRSEGFGFNIVESILLGVPVLCSAFGGVTDRLADNEPPLIPVSMREVGREMGPYRAAATWAEPDIDAMERIFLEFFSNTRAQKRFQSLQKRLAKELSAATVGESLVRELSAWCGLNASLSPNPLEAFRGLATARHDECFALGYVGHGAQRSPSSPGLPRLGEIAARTLSPTFAIITPTFNSEPKWLYELYDDLLQQTYPSWEWCLADDGSTRPETLEALRELRRRDARIKLSLGSRNQGISAATNAAVAIAQSRYVVMVDHDDRLSPDLLATYLGNLDDQKFDGILYCDEDKLDASGSRCQTYYKPDWSPEHLLSCMYVLHCLCIRKSTFLKLGGYRPEFDGAQDHDFVLRVAAADKPIRHVDQILYHWRISPGSAAASSDAKSYAIEVGRRAVGEYLASIGVTGNVDHGLMPGLYRVRPQLPGARVSLNILTGCTPRPVVAGGRLSRHVSANANAGATYVEQFVRSIMDQEPDLDFDIRIIVDAQHEAAAAPLARLDPRVQVVPFHWRGAHFNFAAKANFAVRSSATDRVVLLNDDMQALESGWLRALLEPLELPGVGVVGGRLMYADNTVQHSGMALGVLGAATQLFEGVGEDHSGYNLFNVVIRNYSAVTGAMMAFRRGAFDRVGGFDEEFPIDYNDIDFCLKLAEAGLRSVYTPFAMLRHFESRSATRLAADALDSQRFHARWAAYINRDPFYNRNLPRDNAQFAGAG